MKLMSKREAAKIIRCDVEDLDMVMGVYGITPMGGKSGIGGGYLPLMAPLVRSFLDKREALEAELLALIAKAVSSPMGLHFTLAAIRKDMETSEGPVGFPDALQAHAVALDGE